MKQLLRNTAAVIIGFAVGSAVNMALVTLGPTVIPPPNGVDVSDMESLAAGMHLFEPQHFVFPFLAHALGTFVGALTAFLMASSKQSMAYVVAILFLLGGIYVSKMLPAPVWYTVVDLITAYIPMAWLSVLCGEVLRQKRESG